MPSGLAARARELFAITDRSNLVPQESVRSQTGYKNVIEVGGKYQARLQAVLYIYTYPSRIYKILIVLEPFSYAPYLVFVCESNAQLEYDSRPIAS